MLKDYPDVKTSKLLYEGFSFGFFLHYEGPREATDCVNLASLKEKENIAFDIALKEISLGRLAGPFDQRPLPNLRLSPVGLVPKKDGTYRLIHHLSHPEGSSVNDFIPNKFCTVQYASFDNALSILAKLGRGSIAVRLDIKSAFRLLPVHPSDFDLLGYKIMDKYFVDKCLPFGCSISCSLFEKFSTFLEWYFCLTYDCDNVIHYLDDFLIASYTMSECKSLISNFELMCKNLGVPLATEKTIGPASVITFLGLEIDTNKMCVRIPEEKLSRLKVELEGLLNKKKATLRELQSVTGLLNFCTRAIPPGRSFLRRFYDAMTGLYKPYHKVRVNSNLREDIRVWLTFLDLYNGVYKYDLYEWNDASDLNLYTDSAGSSHLGCAAIFVTEWVFFQWPVQWRHTPLMRDITFLELVPIVLAIHIWGSILENKRIILNTDNNALVAILNKKSSKSKRVMRLIRPLVLHCLVHNIQIKASHIQGKSNVIADSLSRLQWSKFFKSFPQADVLPRPIPQSFLQAICNVEREKS